MWEENKTKSPTGKNLKALKPIFFIFFIVVIVISLVSNSAYTVNEQEKAVVLTFGNPTYVKDSGLGFKIPFIQSVRKVDTTIRGFAIGYDENNNQYNSEAAMITNDYNFVNVDFFVEWSVTDPIKALYNSSSPVNILSNIVQGAARNAIGSSTVDNVLTTGKGEIQSKIKSDVVAVLEELDLGIQVHNVTIQDAEPPTWEVISAFSAVEDAKQQMDTFINDANKYKNQQIPAARADADKEIRAAEADKESRVNEAVGQVARFNEMFAEYEKNKEMTKKRLFFEAMEEILPDMEVIIENNNSSTEKIYPVKSFMEVN